MLKLAAVVKQVPKGVGMGSHDWSRRNKWQLHQSRVCPAGQPDRN
jgi:hypothetical protein